MGAGREGDEQVDVLIVTAVKDEWDAVLAVDTGAKLGSAWEKRPGTTGPEVHYRAFMTEGGGELRIAVVQAFGMGREQAVIAAAPLLERHPEIRCLAMCGVCAGRRGDVALGDVIIADRTWPYDAGKLKATVDEQGHRTECFQGDMDLYRIHPPEWKQRAERFQPDPAAPWIKQRPRSYEEQGDWVLECLVKNEDPLTHPDRSARCPDWGKVLEQLWKVKRLTDGDLTLTETGGKYMRRRLMLEPDGLLEPEAFKVVVGPIASGAPVVQDPTIFDRLAETAAMRKVVGLEMETSAILALAYLRKVPHAVVMKGVMDHANAFKSDNMKSFAARASAECLIAFLRQNLPTAAEKKERDPLDNILASDPSPHEPLWRHVIKLRARNKHQRQRKKTPRKQSQRASRFRMMLNILEQIGSPHLTLPCVHVAGSNGKGSVCAMVESIARNAGLRTGLYVSPHVSRMADRIRINGSPISEQTLSDALATIAAAAATLGGEQNLSLFEHLTIAALMLFKEAAVDLAIVEVGIGGQSDATNVIVNSLVTAITTVALEHTELLGHTVEAIARNKAGIFKQGVPVVLGSLEAAAAAAAREVALHVGAKPIWHVIEGKPGKAEVFDDSVGHTGAIYVWPEGDGTLCVWAPGLSEESIRTRVGLAGAFQRRNAAVATGIALSIAQRWPRVRTSIEVGLSTVTWLGRYERIVRDGITIILDCAHNMEAAVALAQALAIDHVNPMRTFLVFGAFQDKKWSYVLSILASLTQAGRFYTAPGNLIVDRGYVPLGALETVAPGRGIEDPSEAIAAALAVAQAGDSILVTGSNVLVGNVRAALMGEGRDPVDITADE